MKKKNKISKGQLPYNVEFQRIKENLWLWRDAGTNLSILKIEEDNLQLPTINGQVCNFFRI